VGYIHALAHSLGGKYGTPHGLANAVLMPYVLESYGTCVHKKLHELAIAAGVSSEEDAPFLARYAEKEANPLYPVPKLMTQKELEGFYYKVADWSK
jgi:alcohol dehydrogenase class IV